MAAMQRVNNNTLNFDEVWPRNYNLKVYHHYGDDIMILITGYLILVRERDRTT